MSKAKILLYLVLASGLAVALPALTQESGEAEAPEVPDGTAATDAETTGGGETADAEADVDDADAEADESEADGELPDDADLDEQTYEEDEDEFVPTEEIPSGEPIPFPTNI